MNIYSDINASCLTVKQITDHSIASSNKSRTGKRFAVFACSIHSTKVAYTFYAPISAAAWQRIGYDVIAVFVGDFKLQGAMTSYLNITQQLLRGMGTSVLNIQCNASYAIKISQLIRVFVGFIPGHFVGDDDDIITTDSDLIPIDRKQYEPSPNSDGFMINSYCCGLFQRRCKIYRMFAMSHIFLSKRSWRALLLESAQRAELLTVNASLNLLSNEAPFSFDTISLYVRHEFKNIYDQNMTKGDTAWYMDQIMCSMLITDYRDKYPNLAITERNLTERLDRDSGILYWNRSDFEQFGDAHLPHKDIFIPYNWNILNRLLRFLFSETQIDMFNNYYQQYRAVDKGVL